MAASPAPFFAESAGERITGVALLTKFDRSVLKAVGLRHGSATYVLRNMLAWGSDHWGCGHWPGLETPKVLRACRRLQKRGLVAEVATSYAVMKCWALTDAGCNETGRVD